MPSSNVDIGTGSTIVFGTSGFSADITNFSISGLTREVIDVSHLGTSPAGAGEIGSREYLAGDLSDAGEISINGNFNPDLIPPIEGAPETITVTFPEGAIWTFSGQMTSYGQETPLEDKMSFTATVKAVGPITVTPVA